MKRPPFAVLVGVASIAVASRATAATVICNASAPGADMSRKLQSCMDALPSDGGVVDATAFTGEQDFSEDPFAHVGPATPIALQLGTVNISYAARITLPNDSSITGHGHTATVLRQRAGSSLAVSMKPKAESATNVTLKGFTLDLNESENARPGQLAAIDLGVITNATITGIAIKNFFGKRCESGRCTGVGLAIAKGTTVTVQGCRFEQLGAPPLQDPSLDHQSDGVHAAGDFIQILNNYFDGISDAAIVVENARDVVVVENEIHGSAQGITASAPNCGGSTRNVRIAANDLYGMLYPNGQAIHVFGTDCSLIAGSACSPNANCLHGKTVDHVQIANNRIFNPLAGGGIVVDHGYDITLLENLVDWASGILPGGAYEKDGVGILVKATQDSLVSSNVVDSAPKDGIHLTGSSSTSILNNTSQYCGRRGYLLQDVHDIWVENNRAFSNDQSESGFGAGFWLDTAVTPSAVTLKGNHSTGATQGRGLTIVRGKDVRVEANNLRYNANSPGLHVLPSASVSVTDDYHYDQWPIALSDVTCVGATGENKSYFSNVDCTGSELYFVPDGGQCQPYSSTGAVCGTTQGVYTVKSYRTATGSCINQWAEVGAHLGSAVGVFREQP